MGIRKFWMIPLFLLFILMFGCVSASGDFDDAVSYNQSDNQIIESNDFNEVLSEQSGVDSPDAEDGVGAGADVLSSENSDENVGAGDDEVLGETLTYKDLFNDIYGKEGPVELTLYNDYVYDKSKDSDCIWRGGIKIHKNVTIHGNGHKIDGRGLIGHFGLTTVDGSSGILIIDNLNLVNGKEIDDDTRGGSILVTSKSSLTATDCNFSSCKAKCGGVIVASVGTSLNFTGCTFSNNEATATTGVNIGGGAIFGATNFLTVTNCAFTNNSAFKYGGAIEISRADVTIKGTTFSGNWLDGEKNAGAALYVHYCHDVTVENSKFDANRIMNDGEGAAISAVNSSTITIVGSNFTNHYSSGNGTAISSFNCSNFNICESIFRNNTAGDCGGAIYINKASSLIVRNSVFMDNHANRYAGAVYVLRSNAVIDNSNFTDNSAEIVAGAIRCSSSNLTIGNSSFSNNYVNGDGGVIHTSGNLSIFDSSFSNNHAENCGGAIFSGNGTVLNIFESSFTNNEVKFNESRGGAIFALNLTTFNVGNSNFTANKVMNDSSCYGGAIYAKRVATLNIMGSHIINNVAVEGAALWLALCNNVKIADSTLEGNSASGIGIIYSSVVDYFTVERSTFANNRANVGNMIVVGNTVLNVNDTTFEGNDGGVQAGAIYLNEGPSVTIVGSRFINNNATHGGAIATSTNVSSLIIRDSSFTGNRAPYGGAIDNEFFGLEITGTNFTDNGAGMGGAIRLWKGSTASIEDSNFIHNLATVYGVGYAGAIYVDDYGNLNVRRSNFTGNVAVNDSGAIMAYSSNLTIVDSNFNDNNANIGAAIYASESTLKVEGSNFTGNVAVSASGAIIVFSSNLNVTDSNFEDNKATAGAGIYAKQSTLKVEGSTFTNNEVSSEGGAIYVINSDFNVIGSNFNGNRAQKMGGAIYSNANSVCNIFSSTFVGNSAADEYAGAIFALAYTSLNILDSTFNENVAPQGSAILAYGQNLFMSNNTFNSNHASGAGAIYLYQGSHLNILKSNFTNNTGRNYAAIFANNATLNMGDSIFNHNNGDRGYGVYANMGLIRDSIFMETDVLGGISESGNQYFTPTLFTIDNIGDIIYGKSFTVKITESHSFTGTVNVTIGSKTYEVTMNRGSGIKRITDLPAGTYKVILDFPQTGEYYSSYAESNEFYVRYQTEFSIASIPDVVLGESVVIDVNESYGYTGDVSVVIGSKSYVVSLINGRGTITVNDLGVGSYKTVIDFQQNDVYTSAHAEGNQFNVRYNTSFAIASVPDVVLGEAVILDVSEANGYSGDVSVVIGSKSYVVSLTNGKGTMTVNDLDVGTYTAIINFSQSGDYVSAHDEGNQFKVRYQPEFTMSQIPISLYGNPISFSITETHGLNATVKITVGSFEDSVELNNGMGSVYIASIDVGTYSPALNFTGSDTFVPAMANGNEFVVKYASFDDLNDVVSAGGTVELDRNYTFDERYDMQFSNGIPITKNVVINGNGHVIDAKGLARIFDISNGAKVTLENVTLVNGNAENGGAIQASADSSLTVMNSNFDNNTAGGEGSAIYSEGILNVSKSSFTNNPAALGSGIHADNGEIVNSSIIGGGVSGNVHVSEDCFVILTPLFEIANINDFVSGASITISVSESHNLTATVEVTIGSEHYLVDVVNGSGAKTVTPKLTFGKYVAVLKFNETKDYYNATAQSNLFQVSINPEIQIAGIADTEKGKDIAIKLTANRLFTGQVTVTIDSVGYAVDVADGVGSRTITPNLNPGEYKAAVSYPGNENYTAVNAESNAFKIYYSTQITSKDVTTVYNGGQYLYVTLKDSDGNAVVGVNVKIEIPKAKTVTPVTDKNGQVKILLNGISSNTYAAKITFEGNAVYAKSAKSVNVIVKKATPKLTASKKTFKKSVKVKKYSITLKDNNGKAMNKAKVTIKIKNKSFSATVNKKGKATFKITKFNKKGKFTAKVTYKGNACYNKVSKNVKIAIK